MRSAQIPVADLRSAAKRPEVVTAMRELYARVDEGITAKSPTCWNKGECCRFGQYGHRLYVTALEVVYFLATEELMGGGHPACFDPAQPKGQEECHFSDNALAGADSCPRAYQGKCHARPGRPLGCRVFYCDPQAQDWQGPMTEQFLGELRRLHEQLGVPYFYADWMSVLAALRCNPA